MKKSINRLRIFALIIAGAGLALIQTMQTAMAQSVDERIIIEPLFEYPTAPDSMDNLQDRSDWLMLHFWDNMDFSRKETLDQNALNDAFRVYVAPMQFATPEEVDKSVTRVIEKISKNPALSIQFAKAAEEALYGPRALVWNDQIYLRFIDNVIRCKGVKKERKLRYDRQHQLVGNTLMGNIPPEFDYLTPDGKKCKFTPGSVVTLIEFGDPDCIDCRHARLKMESNVTFSTLVEQGKINVMFINVDPDEGWEAKLAGYPAKWHIGASDEVGDIYDIRVTPSIYLIDSQGKVAAKNVDIETAIQLAIQN